MPLDCQPDSFTERSSPLRFVPITHGYPLPHREFSMKRFRLLACLSGLGMLAQCHPYSGTGSQTRLTSMRYGSEYRQETEELHGFGAATGAALTSYLVGYLFSQAGKEIRRVRDGKFGEVGADLHATRTFPTNGYLLILRTVKDPDNKYPDVASVRDLRSGADGTIGSSLRRKIVSNTQGDGRSRLNADAFDEALESCLAGKVNEDSDKVGFLAICPLVPLEDGPSDASKVYGIGLAGMYFPLLNGLRFRGEETSLARRIAKSREVMDVEIYGPNGSGFTTGAAKIPLVWSPPGSGRTAEWITGDMLYKALPDTEQRKELEKILSVSAEERLKNRQAFIAPAENIRTLLRADYQVVEGGETTGWIIKGLEKAKSKIPTSQ